MRYIILLLPWLELFTLIKLGTQTSALTALAYVFGTFMLGLVILQRQGRGMLERLRQGQQGRVIGPELLLDDMAMGFAGLLLIIPGMVTDLMAAFVAFSPLRRRLAVALFGPRYQSSSQAGNNREHDVIEGSFRRLDDEEET